MAQVFEEDMKKSHLLTPEEIKKQGRLLRTLQSFLVCYHQFYNYWISTETFLPIYF